MDECAKAIPLYRRWFKQVKSGTRHISAIGIVLSDYNKDFPYLWKAFYRFQCISLTSGIEYEQAYFALHENEFKGIVKQTED